MLTVSPGVLQLCKFSVMLVGELTCEESRHNVSCGPPGFWTRCGRRTPKPSKSTTVATHAVPLARATSKMLRVFLFNESSGKNGLIRWYNSGPT